VGAGGSLTSAAVSHTVSTVRAMDTSTPAQARIRDELLAWDEERPLVDPELAPTLRAELEAGARSVLEEHGLLDGLARGDDRYDETLWISKSRLDRVVCDGLYRAELERPFEYNAAIAVGTLSHRAIELDHATRRARAPEQLVDDVWHEIATRPSSDRLGVFINGLDEVADASLRQAVEQLLTEHRDVWPPLPSWLHVRMEQSTRVELLDGRVVLLGTPDITLGRVRDDRARMLLVDFKTGMRRPEQERQELRFYALLLTLKHGQPPFRWAVHYVAEGAWDAEDFSEDRLRTAVRRTIDGIDQAARLSDPDAPERLRAGRWCRFCPRRDGCPEYLSQGDGTVGP